MVEIIIITVLALVVIGEFCKIRKTEGTVKTLKGIVEDMEEKNSEMERRLLDDKKLLDETKETLEAANDTCKKYEETISELKKAEYERHEAVTEDACEDADISEAKTVIYDGPNKKKQGKIVCSKCGGSVGGRGKVNFCSWCGSKIEFTDEKETQTFAE